MSQLNNIRFFLAMTCNENCATGCLLAAEVFIEVSTNLKNLQFKNKTRNYFFTNLNNM